MISFLVTEGGAHTIESYLRIVGADASRIEVLRYEDLEPDTTPRPGAYIFADLERLSGETWKAAVDLRVRLDDARGARILNDPRTWLDRERYLRYLRRTGTNDFDAYPARLTVRPSRYPVFLRHRSEHNGALTPLLHTSVGLRTKLLRFALRHPGGIKDLLVVEFSDTRGSDGVFRKYAAFRVGNEILPRHVFFSTDWMVKTEQLTEPHLLDEELEYLTENPHAAIVLDHFEQANVNYGRIDYALADDHMRVWEINTNPSFAPEGDWGPRAPAQERFLASIKSAFDELAVSG